MFQKLAALCSAGVLCCTMMSGAVWHVSAEDSVIESVTWEKSEVLYYEVQGTDGNVVQKPIPDSQITGQIAVTVHEHPVRVIISRYSSEAPVTYYDVELAPKEGQSATEYIFLVDYSECPQDPTQFEKTYTSPQLTGIYSAAYSVTVSQPKTEGAVYTEDGLVIADPHAETSITGTTQYHYDITFSESAETPVSVSEASAEIPGTGDLTISRGIQMLWKPYTLGDADDNGIIDVDDAYSILLYYSSISAGLAPPESVSADAADVNEDGIVDATDAYLTLLYYACQSAGEDVTLEEIVAQEK